MVDLAVWNFTVYLDRFDVLGGGRIDLVYPTRRTQEAWELLAQIARSR